MTMLMTKRLILRPITTDDDQFMLTLLNEPSFIEHIADRGVRTLAQAKNYIKEHLLTMSKGNGFTLFVATIKDTGQTIGFCGLLQREYFDSPDIGFAFLQSHCQCGYGYEVALAVLNYEIKRADLPKILAMTSVDNLASMALLKKLGFAFVKQANIAGYASESKIFQYLA